MKAKDVHHMIRVLETALQDEESRGMALPNRCNHGMELRDGQPHLAGDGLPLFHDRDICINITTYADSAEGWQSVYLCLHCNSSIKVPFSRERDKGKKIEVCP